MFRAELPTCPNCGALTEEPPEAAPIPWRRIAFWVTCAALLLALGGALYHRETRPRTRWEQIAEADALVRDVQFERAAEEYERLAAIWPDDARVWFQLALSRHYAGLPRADVESALEEALRMRPDFPQAEAALAEFRLAAGDAERAAALAAEAAAADPRDARYHWLLTRARVQAERPDIDAALESVQAARANGMEGIWPLLTEVDLSLRIVGRRPVSSWPEGMRAELQRAADELRKMVRDNPSERRLSLEAVLILLRLGGGATSQRAAAERDLEDALSLADSLPIEDLDEWSAKAARNMAIGVLWRARGKARNAVDHLMEAVSFDMEYDAVRAVALYLEREGFVEEAEQVLTKAVDLEDENGALALQLAALRLRRGDTEQALQALEIAAARGALNHDVLRLRALAHAHVGDWQAANEAIHAAAGEPDAPPHVAVARALIAFENPSGGPEVDAAIDDLRRVLEAGSRDALIWVALGLLETSSGNHERGLQSLLAAREIAPTDVEAALLTGIAALRVGGEDNARLAADAFREAKTLARRSVVPVLGEGLAYIQLGDAVQMASTASTALEDAPGERFETLVRRMRAEALRLQGSWSTAAEELERLQLAGQTSPMTTATLIDTITRAGDDAAAGRARQQVASQPEAAALLAVLDAQRTGAPLEGVAGTVMISRARARLELRLGQPAQARRTLDSLLDAHPEDVETRAFRALLALDPPTLDLAAARADIDLLRALPRTDLTLLDGRLAAAEGRHADAVPFLERAVREAPDRGLPRLALAESLAALGRSDAAAAAATRAVADPMLPTGHAASVAEWRTAVAGGTRNVAGANGPTGANGARIALLAVPAPTPEDIRLDDLVDDPAAEGSPAANVIALSAIARRLRFRGDNVPGAGMGTDDDAIWSVVRDAFPVREPVPTVRMETVVSPEPGTAALYLLGLVAGAFVVRKRASRRRTSPGTARRSRS